MSYRKTIVAAVCALPLFLTACGSDDNHDASNNAQSSSSAASSSSTDKPKDDKSASASSSAPASSTDKPQDNKSGAPAPAPGGNGGNGQAAPAQGGAPAPAQGGNGGNGGSNADSQQITTLVNGLSNGNQPVADYSMWVANNTCSADLAASGGIEGARAQAEALRAKGGTFNDLAGGAPKIDSVTNVQTNGDTATAQVSASMNGKTQNEKMTFRREGGAWKFCQK